MRAILLAAGMGSRLRPLTLDTPKPLIKINNESMIERQIKALKDIGINEIIVVTGYLKEKFDFLKDKYGVTLVHNDKYDKYNNIYTMYLVREYLNNAYVIEGDIYLNRNFLRSDINKSSYFSAPKKEYKDEWMLNFDCDNRVYDIEVGSEDGRYIMCGVSYWNTKDGIYICNKLNEVINGNKFNNLFWDNVVKDNLNSMDIRLEKINSEDVYEIDSLEDLQKLTSKIS
ncbi:NTP transferase domain-containing protein [Clostridium gasigenes]|uniref:sugar phosphate nucleotidyltransferase n=1 Tax=Clostridium gasigenes TaxID=94869 RepID=UPI001C0AF6B5|nr:sugar phosphate nucleotidyltransferase [Clostridium gasigenes]MBU3138150.1 NTP transferase domain-containing protein [Clostridium gasigenes]